MVDPDESTNPSDTTNDYKVSSFQINLSSGFENKLLPNNLIIVRNRGDNDKDIGEEFGGVVDQQGQPSRVGGPIQVEFESDSECKSSQAELDAQSKSSSSLLPSPGAAHTKINA